MNINRILVPVDFSPASTLAVNYGIAWARKFKAKLSLLHVVEWPSVLLHPFPREAQKVQAQHKDLAEQILPALVGPEDEDDLDVRFIVKAGEIDELIKSVAHEEHADVVVMGTHGRGLFGRLLLGSVTQNLLRKLMVPVLTVSRVSRPIEFTRILFATDFGTDSEKRFQTALALAKKVGSALLVAHVVDKGPLVTNETAEFRDASIAERDRLFAYAQNKFTEFQKMAERDNVAVEGVLAEGEPSVELVRIADENEVDFIMLGLEKKGALPRVILGSTAEPVIRAAHVPVLSVPMEME